MISFNQTPTYDNQIIWVYHLEDGNTTYYLSDHDITLSGQAYDGKVLGHAQITPIKKTTASNGGVGSVANQTISIARNNSYSGLNTHIEGFVTKYFLTSKTVQIGIVWVGATLQSQITWLYEMQVETPRYDESYYYLTLVEAPEYENKELPYYQIQKSYDNEISYFPNCSKDVLGTPIPIVYGNFPELQDHSLYNYFDFTFLLAPTVVVDQGTGEFIISSHELQTLNSNSIYKFSSGIDNFIRLYARDRNGSTMTESSSFASVITLLGTGGGRIFGNTFVHPTGNFGSFLLHSDDSARDSVIGGVEIFDRDNDTYFTLEAGDSINLRFDTESLESYFNTQNSLDNKKIKLYIWAEAVTDTTNLRVVFYKMLTNEKGFNLNHLGANENYYDISITINKALKFSSYLLKDDIPLANLFEYVMRFTNSGSYNIKIYQAYLGLEDVPVSGSYVKPSASIGGKYLRPPTIKIKLGGNIG